jgi:hypothetical protein
MEEKERAAAAEPSDCMFMLLIKGRRGGGFEGTQFSKRSNLTLFSSKNPRGITGGQGII